MKYCIALVACFLFCGFQSEHQLQKQQAQTVETSKQTPKVTSPGQTADQKVTVASLPEVKFQQRKDIFDWLMLGSTVVLTIVGVIGTCLALQTLRAIQTEVGAALIALRHSEKLAAAAKSTADAALLNAKAIVNSERPWLFITFNTPPGSPRQARIRFTATNRGRTPAEVVAHSGEFAFDDPDELKPVPEYPMPGFELAHKKYLIVGEAFEVFDFDCSILDEDQWKEMRKKERRLIFFGHVLYRDLITGGEHETRFCYWLGPADYVGLIVGGPLDWNKHT